MVMEQRVGQVPPDATARAIRLVSLVLRRAAACCGVLQRFAECCSVFQCNEVRSDVVMEQRVGQLPPHATARAIRLVHLVLIRICMIVCVYIYIYIYVYIYMYIYMYGYMGI